MRIRFPLLPGPLRWLGVLAVLAVLVYFSLLTTTPAPPEPGPFWDKQLHIAGYLALGFALAYATATSRLDSNRRLLFVVLTATVVGVGIELLQAPLPDRYYSNADILANAVGAVLSTGWFLIETRLEYVSHF